MARLGRFFVHEVNLAIGGLIAVAAMACAAHYVLLVRELSLARQEVCAARLEVLASRHPYLTAITDGPDKCAALSALTGDPAASPRIWPARSSL